MSVVFNPGKANLVADALTRMTMSSVSHVEESKKDLVKDVRKFARLSVKLENSWNGGLMVHNSNHILWLR